MIKRVLLFFTFIILLGACSASVAKPFLYHVENKKFYGFRPLPEEVWFERVYHEIEECSGLEGNYDAIIFMQADSLFRRLSIMEANVYQDLWGNHHNDTITIRSSLKTDTTFLFYVRIMRHEMGHHVWYRAGKPYGHHRLNEWARCADPEWNTGS